MPTGVDDLPAEILDHIFRMVPCVQLLRNVELVCKRWNEISNAMTTSPSYKGCPAAEKKPNGIKSPPHSYNLRAHQECKDVRGCCPGGHLIKIYHNVTDLRLIVNRQPNVVGWWDPSTGTLGGI